MMYGWSGSRVRALACGGFRLRRGCPQQGLNALLLLSIMVGSALQGSNAPTAKPDRWKESFLMPSLL